MSRYFLWILIALLAFIGGENPYLSLDTSDLSCLFVFFSISFLLVNLPSQHPEQDVPLLSNLNVALLLFFTWAAMGGFYSVLIDFSLPSVVTYLGVALFVFGMLLYLKKMEQIEEIFWVLALCAGINVLFTLSHQVWFIVHQHNQPPLPGTTQTFFDSGSHSFFIHVNYFCGYLLFHLPIAVHLFFLEKSQKRGLCAIFLFSLILIGIGISGSPGGQIVAVFQILALAGYFFRKRRFNGLKLVCAGVLVALLFCVLLTQILKPLFLTLESTGMENALSIGRRPWVLDHLVSRVIYWQSAWEIFKDYWLTGSGPNTFHLLHAKYFMKTWVPVDLNDFYALPPHAHNLFLQIASEMGVIGLGLFLVCLYLFYSTSSHMIRNSKHPDLIFYLTVGFSGYLVHNLIEYNWMDPVFIYYFSLWILLADFIRRKDAGSPGARRSVFFGLVAGYGVIAAIATTCLYLYNQEIYYKILKSSTLQEVETHVHRARRLCPKCSQPGNIMAAALIIRYKETGNPELLSSAEDSIGKTNQEYNSGALLYLAEIRTLQNRLPEARKIYSQVIRFGRHANVALERLKHIKNLSPKVPDP